MSQHHLQNNRRYLLRWHIMIALYQDRTQPLSDELLHAAMQPLAHPTREEMRQELAYLDQRELIKLTRDQPHWQADLTWHGVDLVEYTVTCEAGIARPAGPTTPDMQQLQRTMLRGRILHALTVAAPYPMDETIMQMSIHDVSMPVGAVQLRCELGYLEKRKLITITRDDGPYWQVVLTREGTDIAQGTTSMLPGIMPRPECNGRH
jgi:hypothetical protein